MQTVQTDLITINRIILKLQNIAFNQPETNQNQHIRRFF